MKQIIFFLTLFMLAQSLFIGACSQQWRESDPGVDDQELFAIMGTVANGSADPGTTRFLQLAQEDKTSVVYFAGAPGPMGEVESVLAFDELGVLDSQLAGLRTFDAEPSEVTIFFVDSYQPDGGREFGLMIEIKGAREIPSISKVFLSQGGTYTLEDGEFFVELSANTGERLSLSSFDVIDGTEELDDVIQLKVIEIQSDGSEVVVGKFSTMVGFRGGE